MPITVKSYQRQVQPDTARVPDPINPGAVRGAFGENVYQANQAIGQQVSNIGAMLGKHAIEQKNLQDDAFVAEQNIKDSMVLDGMLNNAENETIDLNGQKIERPKGVLNRMGLNTQGSTNEFDTKYQKYSSQVLSGIKDERLRQRVSLNMLRNYSSAKNTVVSHEAKQYRAGLIDKIEGEKNLKIDNAYGITNIDALNDSVAQVAIAQDKINKAKGVDDATAQLNFRKAIKDTVSNSAMGALKVDPTGELSNHLLDNLSQGIDKESYDIIKQKIVDGKKNYAEATKAMILEQRVKDRFDYISKVIDGSINFENSDEIIRQVGPKDPELADAIQNVVQSGGKYLPTENIIQNMATMDVIKKIFDSPNRQSTSEYLVNFLRGNNGGNIGLDKLSMVMSVAKEHAESMSNKATPEQKNKINIMKGVFNFIKDVVSPISPQATIRFLNDVIKGNLKGNDIIKAGHNAVRQEIINTHPIVGSLPVVPNKIIYGDGGADDVYSGNTEIRSYGTSEEDTVGSNSNEF